MPAALNSASDCTIGKRVSTSDGHKGKIPASIAHGATVTSCKDDTGKEVSYLYSLLSSEDSSTPKDDGKLVIGKYNCSVGYPPRDAVAGLRITGPSTYDSDGKPSKYHPEPSGKIVFESGPFSTFHARLLSGFVRALIARLFLAFAT